GPARSAGAPGPPRGAARPRTTRHVRPCPPQRLRTENWCHVLWRQYPVVARGDFLMGMLDGKVAVITGAGSGMAKASTKVFAREGARVVAGDISGAQKDTAAEVG